jgi:hypothetical protein
MSSRNDKYLSNLAAKLYQKNPKQIQATKYKLVNNILKNLQSKAIFDCNIMLFFVNNVI